MLPNSELTQRDHVGFRPAPGDTWRLPHLDVLRGLAATWVVLFHMLYLTIPNMVPPAVLDRFVKSGGMGVTLFFVVSAFSLCLSSDRHSNEATGTFYLRRFFRIVPFFCCMMAVTLLRDRLAFGVSHSYREVVFNLLFLFNFVPGWQTGIVWASWTIGVEMVFYLVFPYILTKCTTVVGTLETTVMGGTLSVAVYSLVAHRNGGTEFWQWSFFRHLPVFLMGTLVYSAWRSIRAHTGRRNGVLGQAILAGALVAGLALLYSNQGFPILDGIYWQAVVFSLVVLGAALGAARGFFSIRSLRWAGKNSYSIYLTHPPIIVALQPAYKSIAASVQSGPSTFLLCAVLTLCAVFLASEICWRLIEKPGIDAGTRTITMMRFLPFGRRATSV